MPTPTDYIYTVSTDIPSGVVSAASLKVEIAESAIVIALDSIVVDADTLTVSFKDVLSSADKTELDGDATQTPNSPSTAGSVLGDHAGADPTIQEALYDEHGHQIMAMSGGTTQIGMQAVQVLNTPDISSDYVKSWQMSIQPNTTEILDIFIGDDLVGSTGKCYLAGGEYRCRTAAIEGSSLNFTIVDRNDVLGYFIFFGMSRTKLSGLVFNNGVMADIQVGDYAIGGTSASRSKVLGKGTDDLEVEFHEATFTDGENITFERAGAPVATLDCTLGTWDEGDVLLVQESLKDEWIEGNDMRSIHPGGSKEVPEGMYFRCKAFNAETDGGADPLRIKLSLTVGRL
jgi:hypothetical protein